MTRGPATALAALAVALNTCVDFIGVSDPPSWWLAPVILMCCVTVSLMFWSATRPYAEPDLVG